jgi:serine/threonine-protein kinase
MLSGVSSRHVGRILGFGYEKEQPFLVLERLVGETLDTLMKRDGPPPRRRLFEWIGQLLLGVHDCHQAGVIHRDIKPGNIFLVQEGNGGAFVKLIDFGVARIREIANVGVSLTSTHHLIGSMGYMAPEQFLNARGVGPAADLYAVGVVLFRCYTGQLPFLHRSLERVIKMKCEQEPPALSSIPGVSSHPALDTFVATALAREPSHRFRTAREMLDQWSRVVRALEDQADPHRDEPGTHADGGVDVVFEDENANTTLVDASPAIRQSPLDAFPASSTIPSGSGPVTQRSPASPSAWDIPTSPDNAGIQELLQQELNRSRSGKKAP